MLALALAVALSWTAADITHDHRGATLVTTRTAEGLAEGLTYFGLLNLSGDRQLDTYYTEQNLHYRALGRLGVNLQGVSSAGDDRIRAGLSMDLGCPSIGLAYLLFLHVDDRGTPQLEHVYRIDILPWLYLYGFADHHPRGRELVAESQVNVGLVWGLHAVAQYRYEHFAAEPHSVGAGLEYVIGQ